MLVTIYEKLLAYKQAMDAHAQAGHSQYENLQFLAYDHDSRSFILFGRKYINIFSNIKNGGNQEVRKRSSIKSLSWQLLSLIGDIYIPVISL